MSNRNWLSLIVSVVLFVGCPLLASINDHFNNGQLDPAWQVSYANTASWTYTESGTNLAVSGIGRIDNGSGSSVLLEQNFSAVGDFEIKSGMSWDSEGTNATRQTVAVCAYNGDNVVTEGGYCDWWINDRGQKVARIEYPTYAYDSGQNTLPFSGTVEITLRRINGVVNVLWNDQVMLTGYSNSAVDKVALKFIRESYYPGENFGVLSVDYVTAVPEPATMLLFGIGSCYALLRRKHA
jgi:hypothetical protein